MAGRNLLAGNAAAPPAPTRGRNLLAGAENVSRETAPSEPYAAGLARTVASNVLGGAGSELAGIVGAGYGGVRGLIEGLPLKQIPDVMRGMYEGEEARARGLENQFMEQNPASAIGGTIAGAVASPINRALMPFAAPVKGAGLAANLARATGAGATSGAVYGGAQAAPGERVEGAATGGVLGGAVGAAAQPIVSGVSALTRGAVNQIAGRLPFAQEGVAARKVAEALTRDGMTPQQAAARIQELGPEGALMDIGANTRSLARSAYTVPGEGKTKIGDFLTARQEGTRGATERIEGGQIGRITKSLDDLVPGDYYATKEGLKNKGAAGDLYESAYKANQFVESPIADRILKTPTGKEAFARAARLMQDEMSLLSKVDPEMTAALREAVDLGLAPEGAITGVGVGRGLKLRTLDYVKRALGDMENAAKGPHGQATSQSGAITNLRRSLTSELDNLDVTAKAGPKSFKIDGGDYAKARKMSMEGFKKNEAIDAGANFMSRAEFKNPTELKAALANMGPEEKHLFRIGAVNAMKEKIGDLVNRADATKRLMDIPSLESKITLAFDDDAMFAQYIKGLKGERTMFDAYSAIKGGSRTGEVLAEQADATIDPGRILGGIQRMASVNPIDWAIGGAQALGGAKDRLLMPQGVSRDLASLLTGQNVSPVTKQFQQSQMSAAQRGRLSDALRRGLVPLAGSAGGRAYGQ